MNYSGANLSNALFTTIRRDFGPVIEILDYPEAAVKALTQEKQKHSYVYYAIYERQFEPYRQTGSGSATGAKNAKSVTIKDD